MAARLLFLLLVLANLTFFVWAAGYLGGHDAGREPARLANQLAADRLQVRVATAPPTSVEPPADTPKE